MDAIEPVGPLDPVIACDGCGCLIIDPALHATVCRPTASDAGFREQLTAWLSDIDIDQLDRDANANASFDETVTVAVLDQLKRYAETT